jgi:polysaccharide transporter, PST family
MMGLQIGGVIFLARILTPEDFGVFATLLPLIALMAMLRDFGFQTAIVQQNRLDQQQASTYFWLNFGLCLCGSAVIYFGVPGIGLLLNDSRLAALAPATSLAFLVNGFSATHDALLRRNLKFGRVQGVRIVAYGLGVVVAILLGLRGYGPQALAWQQVSEAIALTIGTFLACRWVPSIPSRPFRWPSGMRLAGALVLGRIVDYLRQNADRVLIRMNFSALELGFYDRAYRIMAAPLQQAQGPLMAVALPALSRKRGTNGYTEYFLAFVRATTAFTFPLASIGLVFPEEVVRLMLGEPWAQSAAILRGLSLMSLSWPLMNLCAINFVVNERNRLIVIWPAVACGTALTAFIIGLPWGAAGVATAYGLAFLLLSPFQIASALRHGGIPPARFWFACVPPVVAIAGSSLLAGLLRVAFAGWQADPRIQGLALLGVWFLAYMAILFWIFDYRHWLKEFLRALSPTNRGAATATNASGGLENRKPDAPQQTKP